MLVATLQKTKYLKAILSGDYVPNFWKSHYSCLSPKFSIAYRDIVERLNSASFEYEFSGELAFDLDFGLGFNGNEPANCYFGWLLDNGAVGIDWDFYSDGWRDGESVLVLDIPVERTVLCDFGKFCSYGYGDRGMSLEDVYLDSLLDCKGKCVQVCWNSIKRSDIIGIYSVDEFRKRFS